VIPNHEKEAESDNDSWGVSSNQQWVEVSEMDMVVVPSNQQYGAVSATDMVEEIALRSPREEVLFFVLSARLKKTFSVSEKISFAFAVSP
jgi:hypothetical protein